MFTLIQVATWFRERNLTGSTGYDHGLECRVLLLRLVMGLCLNEEVPTRVGNKNCLKINSEAEFGGVLNPRNFSQVHQHTHTHLLKLNFRLVILPTI